MSTEINTLLISSQSLLTFNPSPPKTETILGSQNIDDFRLNYIFNRSTFFLKTIPLA